jgi:hypothetical protein
MLSPVINDIRRYEKPLQRIQGFRLAVRNSDVDSNTLKEMKDEQQP